MTEISLADTSLNRLQNINHKDFFQYLSSAYEVLRKIFSYLPIEDLETVSKAFEKWQPVVETTKKERTLIESFILSQKNKDFVLWSEASFCLTFSLGENEDVIGNLKKHLSKDAEFIVVKSPAGVIGTPGNYFQIPHQKVEEGTNLPNCFPAFATHVRIPNFPGVGIKIFTWNKNISFEDFRNSFDIPENKKIKCLLILVAFEGSGREACQQKDDFVLFLQGRQSEGFAVGGCLIDSFFDVAKNEYEEITKYIVFYGDNVEAASMVLGQGVCSRKRINAKVTELKKISPQTEKGVIFVFRCCSRNKIFENSKTKKQVCQWEGDALLNHFPATPIVGCYGYGEYGCKYPDDNCSGPSKKRKKESSIWEYFFSTSIVYVGFKK